MIGLPGVLCEKFGLSSPFFSFLTPVLGHHALKTGVTHQTELMFMAISIVVACSAFSSPALLRQKPGLARHHQKKAGCIYTTVSQGYFFDAIYEKRHRENHGHSLRIGTLQHRGETP